MTIQPLALELRDVSRSFGGIRAVDGVDLDVRTGARRALIGPNGAGKTTLFNLITGVLASDGGTVRLFGEEVTLLSTRQRAKRGLGRTYQTAELFLDLTVEENLLLAVLGVGDAKLRLFGSWTAQTDERGWVRQVAEQIRLEARLGVMASELSHGEKRQLEVGMALAMRPKLIMLDEPSSGLSPAERPVITDLLNELPAEVTAIIIEHDMDIALSFADSVTVLSQGRVIANGDPQDIRTNQQVKDVYLGSADA